MKYNLIGDNNYNSNDIRYEILKNRGITDIDKFLNLDEKVVTSPYLFKNMDRAVKCLSKHIRKQSNIYILVDSDPDGLTSSALLYDYLNSSFDDIKLNYIVHNGRIHGIKINEIQSSLHNMDLLIVPDAGSGDYKEHKWLRKIGIDIICLDHHDVLHESVKAIVVNNQLSKVSKNLSGVGMTYKFCKALDDELWQDKADDYLDLVSLGLISDMMLLNDLEVQFYVRKGLEKIKNKGFEEIINAQSFSMHNEINPTAISFYITPMINALFRLGKKEDYELLFKSFANIDNNKVFIYEPKRGKNKGKILEEDIHQNVARMCMSFNGKRKRLSEKMLKELNDKINTNTKILVIEIDKQFGENGMARLVANGFQRKYNKPTIAYYKSIDNKFKGSMAANTGDFKDRLNNTDLFEFVAGHQNASGLEIKKDKISCLSIELEKEFKNEIFEKLYDVDFIVPFDEFNEIGGDLIEDISVLNDYFGRGFESPYILIENISVDIKNVENLGAKKNTIKINSDEVSFLKFKSSENEYDELISWKDKVKLNILGRCSINEYDGGRYPQIIVEEWEVLDIEENECIKDLKIPNEINESWEW